MNSKLHAVLKMLADAAAVCIVIMPVVAYKLTAVIVGPQRAFPGWSQFFSLIPGTTGVFLRRAFYRLVLPSCGPDVCVAFGSVFSHPTARLESCVYIGVGCMIGDATLQRDVLVGSHVSIINGNRQHGTSRLDVPVREQQGDYPRITIGADSWIGDRAVVMADVGKHCIVGAGSVVTKAVPDYAVVAGNPARILGFREDGGVVGKSEPTFETAFTRSNG